MSKEKQQMCPLFPDTPCPSGEEASHQCEIRVNGDFDPMLYFRDQLVLHCALNQSQEQKRKKTVRNRKEKNAG